MPADHSCWSIGTFADGVQVHSRNEVVARAAPIAFDGKGAVLTCICDMDASPRQLSFLLDGIAVGGPLELPDTVTALRPVIAAHHSAIARWDPAGAFGAAHVPPGVNSLYKFTDLLREGRLLAVARRERYELGFPASRWVNGGFVVARNPAISPDDLSYTISRSKSAAVLRWPLISLFLPGVCVNMGCYAYEVSVTKVSRVVTLVIFCPVLDSYLRCVQVKVISSDETYLGWSIASYFESNNGPTMSGALRYISAVYLRVVILLCRIRHQPSKLVVQRSWHSYHSGLQPSVQH